MSTLFSFVWSFILSLIGLEKKDPMQEVYKEDAHIAETDAKAFAAPDRDRATVDHGLQFHADK
jgi:hypothetical protein